MANQTVRIVPKDACSTPLDLGEVVCWFHSHGAFTFVMLNGTIRSYPNDHIWYVEVKNG